ncbi:hypothetical protein KY345_06245, partial [Candidatus Woesearchaeota archaeon]|nr:hypothetical protein [Candidatus Woesearchaeota archaeon]
DGCGGYCEPITGNSYVDNNCCVMNNVYYETGKDNHGDYVSCVAAKVVDLILAGELEEIPGKEIISKAAKSNVNMPNAITGMATATGSGSLTIVTFFVAMLNLTGVGILLFRKP